MPALPALTILLATAGLAALAFTLLILHAANVSRQTLDAAALAELTAFYAAEAADEAATMPLLDAAVARSGDNLGEQSA